MNFQDIEGETLSGFNSNIQIKQELPENPKTSEKENEEIFNTHSSFKSLELFHIKEEVDEEDILAIQSEHLMESHATFDEQNISEYIKFEPGSSDENNSGINLVLANEISQNSFHTFLSFSWNFSRFCILILQDCFH